MFFYEEVLREFQRKKVKYVIVGGIAFNLLGGMRQTLDLDILVDMEDENLLKIIRILRNKGYYVEQPVNPEDFANSRVRKDWIKNKHMKAFNFYKSGKSYEEVDIIIKSPINFKEASKNAKIVNVEELDLPVISIDNLIKMKQATGRIHDIDDIKNLQKFKRIQNEK